MRVGIIGGGISGLTVAYELQKMGIPYDLFEQNEQVGGTIKSIQIKNYLLEAGPNSLQMTPELENLIRELKLDNQLMEPAPECQDRYIYRNGKYRLLPGSLWQVMSSNFFSLKTKYQILQERFLPAGISEPDETIARFFERRFGRELLETVIAPFVSGIHAGDPEKLSMHKTFPKLLKYEKELGSVMAGLKKHKDLTKAKTFSFRDGLQTLPKAIGSKLISLHTGCPVEMLTKNQGKYIFSTKTPELADCEYDVVVIAAPAPKAAALLEFSFPGVSAALQNISYPAVAVVHSVYNNTAIGFPLKGFGALHPKKENLFTAGSVWSSSLYPNRSPENETLFTTMVGGTQQAENAAKPRIEVLREVHNELKSNYKITSNHPVFQHYYLWNQAIPQYDMFINDAHDLAKVLEKEGIFVAANWYKGISVPDCVKRANRVAKKIQLLATARTA